MSSMPQFKNTKFLKKLLLALKTVDLYERLILKIHTSSDTNDGKFNSMKTYTSISDFCPLRRPQ